MVKTIASIDDIRILNATVLQNLKESYEKTKSIINSNNPIQAFSMMRFEKTALDPINSSPLNFIEMLNQSFSDLVVLYGVKYLINKYPNHIYTVRLGAQSGNDIESSDGTIIGECCAITQIKSNDKLKKDAKKLMQFDKSIKKYIFFYSANDTDKGIYNFTKKYPDINCIRITDFKLIFDGE